MISEQTRYQIALTLIKGVGPVIARQLLSFVEDEKALFTGHAAQLRKIPGIKAEFIKQFQSSELMKRADREVEFLSKKGIQPLFIRDKEYPQRLLNCDDAPILLYNKGNAGFNVPKVIGIVGTRNATDEGKINTEKLIEQVSVGFPDALIVSGLAYGIDICAHRAALKHNLTTVAVLGHSLDYLYPSSHKNVASEMVGHGGVVSEFVSETGPDKQNFVKRNRIIAGMCDAIVVIESGVKGGALITARLASSYNRDVLAYPGRIGDEYSKGCHWLIKHNMAALMESCTDLEYHLGWESVKKRPEGIQTRLFVEFKTSEEQMVYQSLVKNREVNINQLCSELSLPVSKISPVLLSFEFDGLIKSLPGNNYRII